MYTYFSIFRYFNLQVSGKRVYSVVHEPPENDAIETGTHWNPGPRKRFPGGQPSAAAAPLLAYPFGKDCAAALGACFGTGRPEDRTQPFRSQMRASGRTSLPKMQRGSADPQGLTQGKGPDPRNVISFRHQSWVERSKRLPETHLLSVHSCISNVVRGSE